MEQNVKDTVQQGIEVIITWGLSVLAAAVILIAGIIAAGWLARLTYSALSRTNRVDETLRHFVVSVVRYGVIVFTVIAVLERFGVRTTSFVAILGAAGLAVGLAFQGTLSHIAAGIMLLLFRPFRVGQFIEAAGVAGTVEAISLFTTELNTPDNVHIILPNGQLWGAAVKNHSHNATRRIDIAISIGAGDDLGKALEVLRGVFADDPRVNRTPEPALTVSKIGGGAVEIQSQVWCASSDLGALRSDLNRRIKEAFDAAGAPIR
jgi:small conductance mechanosensitive channel